MMEKALDTIEKNKMFKPGAVVGVAVSGGSDSMALLHFLNFNREKLDIEVVAIHVDHCTRANDQRDALFVAEYCRENRIRFHKFKVECNLIAKQKGMTLEQACREGRYDIFESIRKRGVVDTMAIAHHQRDQAETILMHILRGSGIGGATGMDYIRDNFYVRPFLDTSKEEVLSYVYQNDVPYVEDETNADTKFSRNLLRQKVFPELRKVWPAVDETLCNFGKTCKEDESTIRGLMNFDAVLESERVVKIPLSYFLYSNSFVTRLLGDCFEKLGVTEDIERKHFIMICELAKSGQNGAKLDLPKEVSAHKEYEYITLARKKPKLMVDTQWPFKISGVVKIGDFGKLKMKRSKDKEPVIGALLMDADKLPEGVVWRMRREGDYIEKFGGGTKKLKSYLSDKKVPARLRDYLPVLALGSEVYAIANVDVSEKLRVTSDTKRAILVEYQLQNWE